MMVLCCLLILHEEETFYYPGKKIKKTTDNLVQESLLSKEKESATDQESEQCVLPDMILRVFDRISHCVTFLVFCIFNLINLITSQMWSLRYTELLIKDFGVLLLWATRFIINDRELHLVSKCTIVINWLFDRFSLRVSSYRLGSFCFFYESTLEVVISLTRGLIWATLWLLKQYWLCFTS